MPLNKAKCHRVAGIICYTT